MINKLYLLKRMYIMWKWLENMKKKNKINKKIMLNKRKNNNNNKIIMRIMKV